LQDVVVIGEYLQQLAATVGIPYFLSLVRVAIIYTVSTCRLALYIWPPLWDLGNVALLFACLFQLVLLNCQGLQGRGWKGGLPLAIRGWGRGDRVGQRTMFLKALCSALLLRIFLLALDSKTPS